MNLSPWLPVLLLGGMALRAAEPESPIQVLVWDERQDKQKVAYGETYLGGTIAEHLSGCRGIKALSTHIDAPEQGLEESILDQVKVIIWWGHVQHSRISPANSERVVERVMQGKLALIALHSAHFAQPFMRLMHERAKADASAEHPGARIDFTLPLKRQPLKVDAPLTPALEQTPEGFRLLPPACVFPAWRADGAPSHVSTLLPTHPIARGLPEKWDIPQTEMYSEPFHIPKPDEVVFEERWDKGEHFRSGAVWRVGKGLVFYFRPGHETYPIYKQAEPLRVLENAVRWLGSPQK